MAETDLRQILSSWKVFHTGRDCHQANFRRAVWQFSGKASVIGSKEKEFQGGKKSLIALWTVCTGNQKRAKGLYSWCWYRHTWNASGHVGLLRERIPILWIVPEHLWSHSRKENSATTWKKHSDRLLFKNTHILSVVFRQQADLQQTVWQVSDRGMQIRNSCLYQPWRKGQDFQCWPVSYPTAGDTEGHLHFPDTYRMPSKRPVQNDQTERGKWSHWIHTEENQRGQSCNGACTVERQGKGNSRTV